jgi:DNA-binding response OmpR family regulator
MKKKRVLIIEDERELRQVLMARIESAGYDVVGVEDGEKGLAAIKGEKPDLVILDLVLPRLSGEEILQRIKGDKKFITLPIIVLTAQFITPAVDKMLKGYAGVELIQKPYEPGDLIQCIEKGLSPSGAR